MIDIIPYFQDNQVLLFYIFGFVSIIPTLIWITFFTKKDGNGLGIVGYYLIKWLRRLR